MRFLFDQDGVQASWDAAYDLRLDWIGEAARGIPRTIDRTTFNLNADRTPAEKRIIADILAEPGFYATLDPIPGAFEAMEELLTLGHDVRIVTSPWASNPTCASDKLNWVRQHLGHDWSARVIITNDKTLVRGDVLIDDKPQITGADAPTWEHVLFDQPYNRDVFDRRRIMNWTDGSWRDILLGRLAAAA